MHLATHGPTEFLRSAVNPRAYAKLEGWEATGDVMIGERGLLLERAYEEMKNMGETMYVWCASEQAIDAVWLPYLFHMTIQPLR
jgi:hypothetical protein